MSDDSKPKQTPTNDRSYKPHVEDKSYRPSTETSYTPSTSQGDTPPPMPKKK